MILELDLFSILLVLQQPIKNLKTEKIFPRATEIVVWKKCEVGEQRRERERESCGRSRVAADKSSKEVISLESGATSRPSCSRLEPAPCFRLTTEKVLSLLKNQRVCVQINNPLPLSSL